MFPNLPQNYVRDLRENFWQLALLSLLGMDLKDMKTIWDSAPFLEQQVTSQYRQQQAEKGRNSNSADWLHSSILQKLEFPSDHFSNAFTIKIGTTSISSSINERDFLAYFPKILILVGGKTFLCPGI